MLSGDSLGQLKLWDRFFMNLKTVALLGRSVRSNPCQVSRRSLLGAFGVSVDTGLGSSRRAVPSLQIPAHKEALRDLSCAPSGGKFVSCADDSHAKIWDLRTLREERTFTGAPRGAPRNLTKLAAMLGLQRRSRFTLILFLLFTLVVIAF